MMSRMLAVVLSLCMLLILSACTVTVPDNVSVDDDEACTYTVPVCAKNAGVEQTFADRCAAHDAEAVIIHEGACRTSKGGNDGPVLCTQEYDPVCAEIEVQCIKAPCYPVRETYGNICMAEAAGARLVYEGECRDTSTRRYVAIADRCDMIRFECDSYQEPFVDETGCGCEQVRN